MAAHPMDVAVLIAYAVAMVAFGLYFYFRVQRYSDYYDGGRTWGIWIVGCAVAATNIGAGNTMGSVAMAYRDGISAGWYVTLQALAFIPFAYIAVHKIYPLKETTLAEYLESRYQPWLRPISAVALALATFAILPAQIVGGATVVTALIGLDYTTAFLTVGATLILYSALGGMPSLTYGDVYQWVLMLGGFLIGVPIFISAAGGLAQVMAGVPDTHASWWYGATGLEPAHYCRLAGDRRHGPIRQPGVVSAHPRFEVRRGVAPRLCSRRPDGSAVRLSHDAHRDCGAAADAHPGQSGRSVRAVDDGVHADRPARVDDERDSRGGRDQR
jgi:Na+(H+)/acetate symporter ActP